MTTTHEFDIATFHGTDILHGRAQGHLSYSPAQARAAASTVRAVAEVVEFERAMEDYKRAHNRPFPTWSEVLEVLRGLGYAKRTDAAAACGHRVAIARGGRAAVEIGALLSRLGGSPLPPPYDGQFSFRTESDRARALDAVRADQGWTSVGPS